MKITFSKASRTILLLVAVITVVVFVGVNLKSSAKERAIKQRIAELSEVAPNRWEPNDSTYLPTGPLPVMEFGKNTYDFGVIEAGTVIEKEFSFANTGNADLMIHQVLVDCGCTVVDYPKDTVKVGEVRSVRIGFDSRDKSGTQMKVVSFITNSYPAMVPVRLTGYVQSNEEKSNETTN